MENRLFSKSAFTRGMQCAKMVWLDAHHPELFDESIQDANIIAGGDEVGELARVYLGDSDDVTIRQTFDFEEMAEKTASALKEGRTIFEATFISGDLVCMADAICPETDNRFRFTGCLDIVEVKASTKVKPYHLLDLAYQVYVIEKAGYKVGRAFLMHVNGDYVRGDELDPARFFAAEDLTEKVREIIEDEDLPLKVRNLIRTRDADEEPKVTCGKHCNSPHACGYQGYCAAHVPQFLLDLAGVGRSKAIDLAAKGVHDTSTFLAAVKATPLQRAQLSSGGEWDVVNKARLQDFLDGLTLPLYFLDFETVQTAIPEFPGTKPWAQVATQFSLHWKNAPCGVLYHTEFLAPSVGDPRRAVAEALVAAIPMGVTTLAYNMVFEKGRIKEMAEAFPDLAGHLMDIHDRMKDLMAPFKNGWLYRPAMGGSYSIKKVLPALFPDDPELDYHELEGVHNGAEAIQAYRSLATLAPDEEARVRRQLLDYCRLDTLAMVKVWEAIMQYASADATAEAS